MHNTLTSWDIRMKKYYILTILLFLLVVSGCASNKTEQKILYKFDKQTSYSTDELLDHLDNYQEGLVINIVLKSEYVTDDYKTKIVPGMTAQEIDAIIKEMREVSKGYFTNLNLSFIESYNLSELGIVEYSSYSANITIFLGIEELSIDEIDRLLLISKADEVEFVEVKRFN